MKKRLPLPQAFYEHGARTVARSLLGSLLVRANSGQRVAGIIVETEAYCDSDDLDLACHGSANNGRPTPRTAIMFGAAGHAYVYFTYGMHWMFNVVTGKEGEANAVLIRALEPVEGIELMSRRRGRSRQELTNGPAKLAQALDIDGALNGACLFDHSGIIWIEHGREIHDTSVEQGPRIGLGKTPEPWKSAPWRFWVKDNPWVSR